MIRLDLYYQHLEVSYTNRISTTLLDTLRTILYLPFLTTTALPSMQDTNHPSPGSALTRTQPVKQTTASLILMLSALS